MAVGAVVDCPGLADRGRPRRQARIQEHRKMRAVWTPFATPSGIRSHHTLVVDAEGWPMDSAEGACSWTVLPPDDKSVVAPYAGAIGAGCQESSMKNNTPSWGLAFPGSLARPRRGDPQAIEAGLR